MRTLVILATVLILATAVNAAADGPKLETEEQKTLYALGLTINRSLSPFNLSPSELELVEAQDTLVDLAGLLACAYDFDHVTEGRDDKHFDGLGKHRPADDDAWL